MSEWRARLLQLAGNEQEGKNPQYKAVGSGKVGGVSASDPHGVSGMFIDRNNQKMSPFDP